MFGVGSVVMVWFLRFMLVPMVLLTTLICGVAVGIASLLYLPVGLYKWAKYGSNTKNLRPMVFPLMDFFGRDGYYRGLLEVICEVFLDILMFLIVMVLQAVWLGVGTITLCIPCCRSKKESCCGMLFSPLRLIFSVEARQPPIEPDVMIE